MKIQIYVADTDEYSIAEVLELIASQVRSGFRKGFDETTKEFLNDEIHCNYFYKLSEVE